VVQPQARLGEALGELVPVELIVFDCDGVLVDSEALVAGIEAELLQEAGFDVTALGLCERYAGLTYGSMMSALAADHGHPVPPDVAERIERLPAELFPTRLEAVPGMVGLVSGLANDRCVASSSGLDRINLSLSVCGLGLHFAPDRIFSAEMVSRPKPAPDLFLLAAERVGVAPGACLVIEDSPFGVVAARSAGMEVIGFVGGSHSGPSLVGRLLGAGAGAVCRDAAELGQRLEAVVG
jgi:HAD superfamily hydrolase (TIGR01509 family)